MTTTISTAMPCPASSDLSQLSAGYEVYLQDLARIRDREIGAQVLANLTGEATASAAEALEYEDYDAYLGWQETATLLNLLGCALRGYIPEYPEPGDNWGWARNEWLDVAAASNPAELAAAFTAVRAALEGAQPPGDGEDARRTDGGYVHPAALERLCAAAAAVCAAPWHGLLAAGHRA